MPSSPSIRPSGLWIPLVTPFRDDAVDHPALARLCTGLGQHAIAGFVVCGSTGEAAALSPEEQVSVLRTVHAHAGGKALMMGVAEKNLNEAKAWISTLEREVGELLHGLLLPAPCYVRPSQDGLKHWFETLADHSPWPLTLYDIPYRTGATIARDTLLSLADHPQIVAIKDCGGDLGKTLAMIRDGRLQVLCGEDLQVLAHTAHGGAGAITASAHLATAAFAELVSSGGPGGKLQRAQQLWHGLAPLVEACFASPNPAPIKAALAARGCMTADVRAPLMPASKELGGELARRASDLESASSRQTQL